MVLNNLTEEEGSSDKGKWVWLLNAWVGVVGGHARYLMRRSGGALSGCGRERVWLGGLAGVYCTEEFYFHEGLLR